MSMNRSLRTLAHWPHSHRQCPHRHSQLADVAARSRGQFILRYDDTDTARSTQEYADGIATDMAWLGIVPDRVEWQSKRFGRYDEVVATMKAEGQLYPCYETADELERRRKRQEARGGLRTYDRAALKLTAEEKRRL